MHATGPTRTGSALGADACAVWTSSHWRWRLFAGPAVATAAGLICVALSDAMTRQGQAQFQSLWWAGVLLIFAPTAATMILVQLSRREAISIVVVAGVALYAVKLLYAPGLMWGYDEMLHFRTVDDILRTGQLFSANSLLRVSPFYPGMEALTAVIVQLSGLTIVQAGFVVIVMARLLTVVSLFLLFERVAIPQRLAGLATLLYMACPSFLHFDVMYAYESLALPLAVACLLALRAAQLEASHERAGLNAVAVLLLVAVVVTHHVTSFILVGTLCVWTLAQIVHAVREQRSSAIPDLDLTPQQRWRHTLKSAPGGGWTAALGIAFVFGWLLLVAEVTVSYLLPQLVSGLAEMMRILRLEGTGRRLFESSGGHGAPLLERVVGIGSVLLIIALIPLGIIYLRRRRPVSVLARLFAVGSLAYPATLALRFTRSGWQVGARLTAFVYIPLALVLAAGMQLLSEHPSKHARTFAAGMVVTATLIFAGGIIAGSSPITRQPSPYDPGIAGVPYDAESLAAADWAASRLGVNNGFVADSASGALLGSVGRQRLVTSEDDIPVSALFLSPGYAEREIAIVEDGDIDYALVDRRIAGTELLKGFVYEKWERIEWDFGSTVSSETVNKFAQIPTASKVFDSGNLQIFALPRTAP